MPIHANESVNRIMFPADYEPGMPEFEQFVGLRPARIVYWQSGDSRRRHFMTILRRWCQWDFDKSEP